MLSGISSPTTPHGGLASSICTPPSSNNTSGDSSTYIDGSCCWYRPTSSATSATTTPHELVAAATSPPTTDASGSTSEYATIPLEWFTIDNIQTPISVSPPDEWSGRSLLPPPATAAEGAGEEALPLPPPRSPPGRVRGPLPGRESEGGLYLRDSGAACQCSEDAADAMTALQSSRAALDHALRHANAAMAVLARFLVCGAHHHQESDLLLMCFLAQKVVTAYRQALCTCGGAASARNGSGTAVQIPEIRVGPYRIVGEEGLLLIRQVVVVELRRLRRVVEQMREKMRDRGVGGGGYANAHSSSSLLLQGFLQAELKSVLAQLGERHGGGRMPYPAPAVPF